MVAYAKPGQLREVFSRAAQQVNPQEYANHITPGVAAMARYAQQNQPDAFGEAASQIGQQQPGLLHSFLGKAALAVGAAALASHFIKLDRR